MNAEMIETINNLKVQAMMFDMDIDWETATLVPKSTYKEQYWLTKWKEREHGKDFDPRFDIDQE